MKPVGVHGSERGATAIIVAFSLVVLLGLAAIALDLSAGYNERRGDQTAADTAALAGGVQIIASQTGQGIASAALAIARSNLDGTYSDLEWRGLWNTCTDPTKNAGGFNFSPVAAPSGWGASTIDCISRDPRGLIRVRIPDQVIATTFGRAIGVNSITTQAVGVARINDRLGGGILPFGLPNTYGDGAVACLSSTSGGNAQPPCDGPSAGNFGTLKGRRFGDLDSGIPENCNASPLAETLSVNIAAGYDHPVLPWNGTDGTILDQCYNFPVNTLNTDTGFPGSGVAEGMATGPLPYGLTPRLQQGSNPKRPVVGYNLDDRPLWYYLNDAGPAECKPTTFVNGTNPDADWNGDGTIDKPESWEHIQACLLAWNSSYGPIFDETLETSPRFSWVPQFDTTTLGNGNSWLEVWKFKSIFLQGTWWKKGNGWIEFEPGENCSCSGNNYAVQQMTAIVIPDLALPETLRGDPAPGTQINPYRVELFR